MNSSVWFLFGLLSLAATFLNSIVLISTSTNNDVIKHLNWSHGVERNCQEDCADIFVGMWNLLVYSDSQHIEAKSYWNTATCSDESGFCEKCEKSMKVVLTFVVACCFCGLYTLPVTIIRAMESGNNRSNRHMGMAVALIATMGSIVTLITFARGCQKYIARETDDLFEWRFGSVWILMVVVAGLHIVNYLAHAFIPANKSITHAIGSPGAQA